jgi:hypothetical protein
MIKEKFESSEEIKEIYEQKMLEVLIYHKLEEFKRTRAIATAVEICDMSIKGMGLDKE